MLFNHVWHIWTFKDTLTPSLDCIQIFHRPPIFHLTLVYPCMGVLKLRPGGKLYLCQVGTDQPENIFGTVHIITHSRNCDVLALSQRLQHSEEINEIITKHPSWKMLYRKRFEAHNDATSQRDLSGYLEVNDINVYQLWILGRMKACELLGIESAYQNLVAGCSMVIPKKDSLVFLLTPRDKSHLKMTTKY